MEQRARRFYAPLSRTLHPPRRYVVVLPVSARATHATACILPMQGALSLWSPPPKAWRLGELPFAEATPNGAEAGSKRSWLTTEATMRCDTQSCACGSLVVMSCGMCIRKGGVGPMQSNVI